MSFRTKKEIMEVLALPAEEFNQTVRAEAEAELRRVKDNKATIFGLVGVSNICRNMCTYCGMRAGNTLLPRYRLTISEIEEIIVKAKAVGIKRLFLISGEDPALTPNYLVQIVEKSKDANLFLSMAMGEQSFATYQALKDAGLDEYVLKFETANPELFSKIKPSTTFQQRMQAIEAIKTVGLRLGSGNIIDFPGQTMENLADDLLLMMDLEINWAPVIPYNPVPNTPLAKEGGRGSVQTTRKEISILRLAIPEVDITAQQPGEDAKSGVADWEGNRSALLAGANLLFVDLTPPQFRQNLQIIEHRVLNELTRIDELLQSVDLGR